VTELKIVAEGCQIIDEENTVNAVYSLFIRPVVTNCRDHQLAFFLDGFISLEMHKFQIPSGKKYILLLPPLFWSAVDHEPIY